MVDDKKISAISFYSEVMFFIKSIFEDPKICKVFHDSRSDSLALHLFANCCPQNIFDVSALFVFIDQLLSLKDIIAKSRNIKNLASSSSLTQTNDSTSMEESKSSDAVKLFDVKGFEQYSKIEREAKKGYQPGLNEVLRTYNAKHGTNDLKKTMKKRFSTFPKDYFLARPIHSEFLVYSAKDVEDLCQIKENMINKLWGMFADISSETIDKIVIEALCIRISK